MQGQPLRVSATQITNPIVAIQPNSPSYVPVMAIPQAMQPYLGYIASLVQIEVESKAGQSPLRIHAHNLLSQNGFQNSDYAELLDMTVSYIHFLMSTPAASQYNGYIENCIQNIVPHVVGAWSAAQVRLYPELMGYLNPQQQNTAQNAVATMQQIANEVMRFKSGGFQAAPAYGYQPAMMPQAQPMAPSWAQPQQGFNYPPQRFAQQGHYPPQQTLGGQPGYAPQSPGAPSGLFVRNNATPSQLAPNNQIANLPRQGMSGSERMLRQLAEQRGELSNPTSTTTQESTQQTQQQYLNSPTIADTNTLDPKAVDEMIKKLTDLQTQLKQSKTDNLSEEIPTKDEWLDVWGQKLSQDKVVDQYNTINAINLEENQKSLLVDAILLDSDKVKWKPSIHQPYHPAWTAFKHKLNYVELKDKSIIAVITDKESKDMDYDAHAIGVTPTTTASFSQNSEGKIVKKESDEIVNIEYPEANIEFIVNDDVMVEISDRIPAITAGVIGSLAGFITKKSQAFHTTTVIAEPILTNSKEVASYLTSMILRCNECTTFSQLHKVMQEMTSPDELSLRERVNQVMTKAINEVMKANISTNVYIDSFEEDGHTLIRQLRKSHTDRIADAIESDQTRIIKSNLSIIDEDAIRSMNETLKGGLPEDREIEGYAAFIACHVTHTHLEYTAAELALAFPRRAVSLLSEELTPVMFHVAREIFENNEHEKTAVARDFIVTKDGVILQLHNGLFNKKAFLVNIID